VSIARRISSTYGSCVRRLCLEPCQLLQQRRCTTRRQPQLPSLHFVGVVLTPVIDLVTMTEAVPCSQRGWRGAAAAAASLPALTVLPTVAPSAGWPPHTAAAAAAAAGYG
jgi:hypothetical protein